MIPSNLAEISGEVFTFSADVGLFDAYVVFISIFLLCLEHVDTKVKI